MNERRTLIVDLEVELDVVDRTVRALAIEREAADGHVDGARVEPSVLVVDGFFRRERALSALDAAAAAEPAQTRLRALINAMTWPRPGA